MIEIREIELFENTVTAVLDVSEGATNILSIRKGLYSNHEWRTAKHHLSGVQQQVDLIHADDVTEIIFM